MYHIIISDIIAESNTFFSREALLEIWLESPLERDRERKRRRQRKKERDRERIKWSVMVRGTHALLYM